MSTVREGVLRGEGRGAGTVPGLPTGDQEEPATEKVKTSGGRGQQGKGVLRERGGERPSTKAAGR